MTLEERVELNRRLAECYHDAYRLQQERGRTDLDMWKFSDDAVFYMPYFTGGDVVPMGLFLKTAGISLSDLADMEQKAYSKILPDWHNVEFLAFPSDIGFAFRARMEGHDQHGRKYSFHACDFLLTNDEGQITRWETHMDDSEFGPVVELLTGQRGPFENFDVYWKAVADHLTDDEGGKVLRSLIGA
jgi:hypothetical protein